MSTPAAQEQNSLIQMYRQILCDALVYMPTNRWSDASVAERLRVVELILAMPARHCDDLSEDDVNRLIDLLARTESLRDDLLENDCD